MKVFTFSILFVFSLICNNLKAHTDLLLNEKTHLYYPYEIGVSNGVVYNFSENEWAYGLHIHLIKKFGISQRLGVGVGYEAILDEHGHQTLSILLHYMPMEHLSINVAPGLIYLENKPHTSRFAIHTELLYEFELGFFHFGPLIGASLNPNETHSSVGLHMAIGF